MQTDTSRRYFFFGLLSLTAVLLFFVFKPFIAVLVVGISLAVVFHPLFRCLKKTFGGIGWLAALLTVLIFLILVVGPLFAIGALVLNQSDSLYLSAASGQGFGPFMDKVGSAIDSLLPAGFSINASERAADFVALLVGNVSNLFASTLQAIFSFILILLAMFYLLKDGEHFRKACMRLSPLAEHDNARIFSKMGETINGVVKGYLFLALVQGTLSGLGMAIFGVPHAALWGVLAGIASLVPTIGTALVLGPAVIYLFSTGNTAQAVGLTLWGLSIVGMIDNLLNPYVIGKKVQIPPLLILFSILGGIALLGPVGILVGPLSMSLLFVLLSMYRSEFRE